MSMDRKVVAFVSMLRNTIYYHDYVAYEGFRKKRQPLLDLAFSVRHHRQYVWLLTQSYFAITKNLRRLAKAIFISYSKERADLKTIQAENDVLTNDELVIVRGLLKESNIHIYTYGVNILWILC